MNMLFPFELTPTQVILGASALGAGVGALYGGSEKKYSLLTKEEKRKRAITNALVGALMGAGIAGTSYYFKDVLDF